MKFYVAAKWCDRPLVKKVYGLLKIYGHSVTVDWTDHELPEGENVDTQRFLEKWAVIDINGVRECDYLVALFEEKRHQRGAMIELGAALGCGKLVIVVGKAEDSSTLLKHPRIQHLTDLNHFERWLVYLMENDPNRRATNSCEDMATD
jgi:nucleoside 2-deoxyribosyltransferase